MVQTYLPFSSWSPPPLPPYKIKRNLLPRHRARSDCTPLATKPTLNNSHRQTSSSSLHCGRGLGWTGPGCGHNLQEWAPNFNRAPTLFETIPRFPVLWAPIPESVTNLASRPGWFCWRVCPQLPLCTRATGRPPPHLPHLDLFTCCARTPIVESEPTSTSWHRPPMATLWRCHLQSILPPEKKHTGLPCHPLGSVGDDPVPE